MPQVNLTITISCQITPPVLLSISTYQAKQPSLLFHQLKRFGGSDVLKAIIYLRIRKQFLLISHNSTVQKLTV